MSKPNGWLSRLGIGGKEKPEETVQDPDPDADLDLEIVDDEKAIIPGSEVVEEDGASSDELEQILQGLESGELWIDPKKGK